MLIMLSAQSSFSFKYTDCRIGFLGLLALSLERGTSNVPLLHRANTCPSSFLRICALDLPIRTSEMCTLVIYANHCTQHPRSYELLLMVRVYSGALF